MKKAGIIALCAVLLFLPALIALGSYIYAQSRPVAANVVSLAEMTTPDGEVFTFKKGESVENDSLKGGFISFMTKLNDSAKSASELPAPLVGTNYFKVVYHSYGKTTEYKYYFSTDPEYAYYTDQNNKAHRITRENAEAFLASDYSHCLYPSASIPVLNIGNNDVVTPASMSWKFLSYSGEYMDANPGVTDTISTVNVSGALKISFDTQPDYLGVQITNAKNGDVVFDGLYENIDNSIFSDNAVYSVTATAKWYESSGRGSHGEAQYRFVANVLAPAAFYVGETVIDPGEFVVISAKNVVDPSDIQFTSSPDIGFTPVFFSAGDYVHAFVPISIDLPYAGSYTFTLTCGEVTQDIRIGVNNKKFNSQTHDYSPATVTTYRSLKAQADFDSVVSQYLNAQYEDLYWLNSGVMLEPMADRSIKTGFGLHITLSANQTTYRHEGVNYVVKTNDKAIAAYGGKVIYVGELTLSGLTVIVDHGGGLKSLYAHLGASSVVVGDVVEQGQVIGTVGYTGFTEGTSFHYGLYCFGVPVCPYDLWEKGIVISPYATAAK